MYIVHGFVGSGKSRLYLFVIYKKDDNFSLYICF